MEMMGFPNVAINAWQIGLSGTRMPAVFRLVSIILGTSLDPSKMKVYGPGSKRRMVL